jgi:Tol biopolymer transport system component
MPSNPGPTPGRPLPFGQVHGWIAYRSDVGVVAVNLANSDERVSLRLSRLAAPIDWSPDGSLLLVREGATKCGSSFGALFVVDLNGSETPLTHGCGHGGSFSPDGTRVVFDDRESIYVADIDGGNRHLLAAGDCDKGWLSDPEWSPDGSRIAFVSYQECPYTYSIEVVNADGTGRHEIAAGFRGSDWVRAPAWSPDGSRIAFALQRGETAKGGGIFTMMAHGSGLRRIADGMGAVTWSPDGSRIAFVRMPPPYNYVPDPPW